ncbi:hypothetical protein [Cupriavidus sp. 8B]
MIATDDGEWLWQQILALQLEGIVTEHAGSLCTGGVSDDWRKIKRTGYHAQAHKRENSSSTHL